MILVLLPCGKFHLGAQTDPTPPNLDPSAHFTEQPVNEVELSLFFIGKHELTQVNRCVSRARIPASTGSART